MFGSKIKWGISGGKELSAIRGALIQDVSHALASFLGGS